jgi:hypothetical protein
MGTLRVTSANAEGEFVLQEGANKIGRGRDNQIRIPHKSISRQHCIITEEEGKLRIRDLASTYGCHINEDKIGNGVAEEGDIIRLGRVRFVYEGELAAADGAVSGDSIAARPRPSQTDPRVEEQSAPEEESADSAIAVVSPSLLEKPCEKHPSVFISLICPKCHLRYCEQCVNRIDVAGREKKYCPYCKEQCRSLSNHLDELERAKDLGKRSFYQSLGEIVIFPLTSAGIWLLLLGTVFHMILDYAAQYSVHVSIVASGYLIAYFQKIISATTQGEEELPGWPDFAEWWVDLLRPLLMFLCAAAVAFLPAIIYGLMILVNGTPLTMSVMLPLATWGLIYLPMAILSVTVKDNFLAVQPRAVISGFVKLGGQYILSTLVLSTMVLARIILANYVTGAISLPVVPELLIGLITIYFVAVEIRLIGLMYFLNRSEFGWSRD